MPGFGPIQTQPRGLLGLLQLKNLGKNPRELLDSVQPTIEQIDMLVNGVLEFTGVLASAAAVGPNNIITVPENETWFVRGLSATTEVLGVGEAIKVAPAASFGSTSSITLPVGPLESGIAAERVRAAAYPGLIILGPGAQLGFWVQALTGAVNVDTAVVFARTKA